MGRAIVAVVVFVVLYAVVSDPVFGDKYDGTDGEYFKPDKYENFEKRCTQNPLDLVFVIDASSSIWRVNFTKGLAFIEDFLEMYTINPNMVKVGAVTFGRGVYSNGTFPLDQYVNKKDLLSNITSIKYPAGLWTGTDVALQYMIQNILPGARRGDIPFLCIVLTDGNSQMRYYTAGNATLARDLNVTMFAIGVGRGVNTGELNNIAGDPKRTFRAQTYSSLIDEVKEDLRHQTCIWVPKPTTPPMAQPCGVEFPADIELVYDAAVLGPDGNSFVSSFAYHTFDQEGMEKGMELGVSSAICPEDAGFEMGEFPKPEAMRERMDKLVDDKRLGNIVKNGLVKGLTGKKGNPNVRKVAVIFVGGKKTDTKYLKDQLEEANKAVLGGMDVFFADAGGAQGTVEDLAETYGGTALTGGSMAQSEKLHSALCNL